MAPLLSRNPLDATQTFLIQDPKSDAKTKSKKQLNPALLQTTQSTRINADNLKPLNKIRKYTPNSPDDEVARPSYFISPEVDKLFMPHKSVRVEPKRNNSTVTSMTQSDH